MYNVPTEVHDVYTGRRYMVPVLGNHVSRIFDMKCEYLNDT